MNQIYDQTHLTLDERKIIQTGLENRCNKVDIARTLKKDPTTIAKEIRKHRYISPRNTFNYPILCIHIKKCGKCKNKCSDYEAPKCKKRDRSPGACNKCPDTAKCHLDKYFYSAIKADKEYRDNLVETREGINLTTLERKELASILKPLLDRGQSIYQIKAAHPEIKQCESTLYNYIESDVFKEDNIDLFSLKEKVQRKAFKNKYKKRKDPANYDGHKYNNYLEFKKSNPNVPTVQMDTVMNSLSGPYIQTFIFEKTSFMIGILHTDKTSESMSNTIDKLEEKLGYTLFRKMFPLILTDRGSEFKKTQLFEFNTKTGESRLNIFYCDAMQSSQKPHVENNHNYVRDIILNEIDISNITQEDLNLVFSHINSTPREIYNGKTPYEMLKFLHEENFKTIVKTFNITEIKRDEVTLKPYLIKRVYKK
jgi:transposase, IS30 family